MTNARTSHRLLRTAVAGLAGAAALLSPLAGTADAELTSGRDLSSSQYDASPFVVRSGTVSSQNGILTLNAAASTVNDIWLVGDTLGGHLVDDRAASLTPGAGCFVLKDVFTKPVIRCAPATHIIVRTGSYSDNIFVSAGSQISTDVDAGSGHDTVQTESSADWISGGTGGDTVNSGSGSDSIIGGDDGSIDRLDGGTGVDDCRQGEIYANCEGAINAGDIR